MILIGHIILFFLAGFAGFLRNADRGSSVGIILFIALPVAGVYFLGWWSLLTFVAGMIFGGRVFWENVNRMENQANND